MKKVKIGAGIGLSLLLIIFIIVKFLIPYLMPVTIVPKWEDRKQTEREKILYSFISNKMMTSDGGIKTNYKNMKNEGDITRGDSVLSESEGLMLIYYVERNDREGFNKTLEFIKNNMVLKNGLISWRVRGTDKNEVSSTIDDLRIVKALIMAGEQWHSIKYRYYAIKIANAVYENLKEGNLLADYNNGKEKSKDVTLCYIDLPTLKYLSTIDFKWKYIYTESKRVLDEGYISDKVPLYRKNYNIKTKKYDSGNVDMVLNSIILLNEAEDSQNIESSLNWIIDKFKKDGAIYSEYNSVSGKEESDVQSTAIYANLLRIATIENNKELYNMSLKKLDELQVINKQSPIYGGFGNEKTLELYSFDNLNALLAYRDV